MQFNTISGSDWLAAFQRARTQRNVAWRQIQAKNRADVAAWKAQYSIYTHLCRGGGDWLALSMSECCAALNDYKLTAEERTDGAALMAGYCRLLDEAGLIEDGHKTQHAAVAALVTRIRAKTINSHPDEILGSKAPAADQLNAG
jgi:hypothetical protein